MMTQWDRISERYGQESPRRVEKHFTSSTPRTYYRLLLLSHYKLDYFLIKISPKNCQFDAKFTFLKFANFALATFLHSQVSVEILSPKKFENNISREI